MNQTQSTIRLAPVALEAIDRYVNAMKLSDFIVDDSTLGYPVSMDLNHGLRVGVNACVPIHFTVLSPDGVAEVDTLEPYLNAALHIGAIHHQKLDGVYHYHAMADDGTMNHTMMSCEDHNKMMINMTTPDKFGPHLM